MKTNSAGFRLGALLVLLTVIALIIGLRQRSARSSPPPTEQAAIETLPDEIQPVPTVTPDSPRLASDTNDFQIPLFLFSILIEPENGTWLKDKAYQKIPRGLHTLGGVEFALDGMIQLQGSASEMRDRKYRTHVNIPVADVGVVATNIRSLHLLGATRYDETVGARVAEVIWHYTDRTAGRTPLTFMNEIRDWTRQPFEQPSRLSYPFSKVVWAEADEAQPNRWRRLYRVTLPNPQPAKTIQSLDLVSGNQIATLFVVGATLDSLAPGQRRDDSPDLEPTDREPARQIAIEVLNEANQPVAQVNVRPQIRQSMDRAPISTSQLRTDAGGRAMVYYPASQLDQLEIAVSHDDYGNRKMNWDLKAGDVIPAIWRFKLMAGVRIGGVVVNESDNPISGATIAMHRFWTGNDEINRRGDQPDFATRNLTTDGRGEWSTAGLPSELLLLNRIGFDVKHPDYMPTNITTGAFGLVEKALRDGSFKLVLRRGFEVAGRVEDENGSPVSGATVWAGRKFYRDRQETKSSPDGRFFFRNVPQGEKMFSVMADNLKPDSKTIEVKTGMEEIVFHLGAGSVIRGLVQNESGEPLFGARVGLEDSPGNATYEAYEFTANTDSQGRFEWNGAPNEPTPFYIFSEGYEARRGVRLNPNEDNVIKMHRSRQLQGLVLDDSTEQPVRQIKVRVGKRSGDNVYGVVNSRDFAAPDGRFSMEIGEEEQNAVAVLADGYAEKIETFPPEQDGVVQLTVRLKASAGLDGMVVNSAGAPAVSVSVAATRDGMGGDSVRLSKGRLESYGRAQIVITDAEGRFHLTTVPETGNIVASGELGFAFVPIEDARASGRLVLQAWGRIEGKLKIAGQAAPGEDLLFSLPTSGLMTDFNSYKTTTDEQGNFTMENLPPAEGSVVRLIKTSPHSWTHSHQTPVTIEPGKTTQLTLGDSGGVLRGTVRFETRPTGDEPLSTSGNLSTARRAFLSSLALKPNSQQRKSYAVVVKPDGSFMIDSVLPGTYELRLTAAKKGKEPWNERPVATGQISVTVPDSANPFTVIDLGEILLKSQ